MHECKECKKVFSLETSLARHLRTHQISYQAYVLKHKYDNVRPLCACGCCKTTAWRISSKDFCKFIHGHGSVGRQVSASTRKKIGEKNSVKMSEYMKVNPHIAKLRVQQMHENITDEITQLRLQRSNETMKSQRMRDHMSIKFKQLWNQQRTKMIDAKNRASITWNKRFRQGMYDDTFKTAREKISKAITQNYKNGTIGWSKGTYFSDKKQSKIHYRSGWELQFMQLLDESNDVYEWEYESQVIKYKYKNKVHRYIPDFIVTSRDQKKYVIEIKPTSLRTLPKNIAKSHACRIWAKQNNHQYVDWDPTVELSFL